MQRIQQPISIYFVWHYADENIVKPLIEYCFDRFQNNLSKPFSRNMNLPVFFRTSSNNNIPREIISNSKITIIFCFSSENITGDENWRNYYDTFLSKKNQYVIPVAINSEYGFELNGDFKKINFMRLFEFNDKFRTQQFLISAAHEICRFAFYEGGKILGKDSAITLFISHTKSDDWAIDTAKRLKTFTDTTLMNNFFDSYDIHTAHDFENEITKNIHKSTLISIQSDNYSSRYWCQKEIIIAKENNIPIVIVNHLKLNEDRAFPHAVNVPSVRVESKESISDTDIHNILESALLETLRYNFHSQKLKQYKNNDTKALSRPPELTDIPVLLSKQNDSDKGTIKLNFSKIIYPDPPVYGIELKFMDTFGIKAETPLSIDLKSLKDVQIGISISELSEEELVKIGHDKKHLISLSQTIARHLLYRHATLIYGGDLRPGGFTEYLCEEARIAQDRLQEPTPLLQNYSAWPIYTNNEESTKEWNAKNNKVMKILEVKPPEKVKNSYDIKTFLRPFNPENCFAWSQSLTKMRQEMINKCDYRISAGGRSSGYKGKYPGVLEEILIAITQKKPIYLLGGYGGITSKVCELLQNAPIPEELTQTWQINKNSGYKELIDLFLNDNSEDDINYESVVEKLKEYGLKGLSENNGLTKEENKLLFKSEFSDEAIELILKGIKATAPKELQ